MSNVFFSWSCPLFALLTLYLPLSVLPIGRHNWDLWFGALTPAPNKVGVGSLLTPIAHGLTGCVCYEYHLSTVNLPWQMLGAFILLPALWDKEAFSNSGVHHYGILCCVAARTCCWQRSLFPIPSHVGSSKPKLLSVPSDRLSGRSC